MSEKRFTVMKKFDGSYVICDKGKMLVADDCCDLLNEQSERIKSLEMELDLVANFKVWSRRKLEEENEQLRRDEQLYAKEILRLKEELKEKEMLKLGGDY